MPDDRPPLTELCDGDPLARALAALAPAAPAVDVPGLMYQAGRASRERAVGVWRRAFAVTAVALGGTWVAILASPGDAPAPPVARHAAPTDTAQSEANLAAIGRAVVGQPGSGGTPVPDAGAEPPPAPPESEPPPNETANYLRVRDAVLDQGLAGLPAAPAPAPDLERSLNLPSGVFAYPGLYPRPAPPTPGDGSLPE